MEFISSILGTPLGYIINFAYSLTNSYGLAVIIFAVAVRVLFLFPINVFAQKNSIRLLKLQPELGKIKKRFADDKEKQNEEQYNLFKRERYSPFIGLIPLFAQLFFVIGIMQVMLDPMRYLQGVSVSDVDFTFLGINLNVVPSLLNPSLELVMPLLSMGSALVFCLIQNEISPGALSQSKGTNIGLTIVTVALSLYLSLALPVSVGIYWTVSNLMGVVTIFILNTIYNPYKLAPDALEYIKSIRKTPGEIKAERKRITELKLKEKLDVKRFNNAKKELVFYALTGGQYKYYKTLIEYIHSNSDIHIHYLTNDPEDALFEQENPKLIPYYASQKKTISLMLKLDADIMVTTVPDLQSYHLKRSIVREDIEYINVFHAPVSTMMQYKETAFDHFDTVFCIGPHHIEELRRREEMKGLKKRNLVKAGYGLFDELRERYRTFQISANAGNSTENETKKILIAPSWQNDNIFETCIDEILDLLLGRGYLVTLRPHPQFMRLFPERIADIQQRYKRFVEVGELIFECDFSGNESIYTSDLVITDWSGIAYEFVYCTLKPCLFINTPQKIMNPNYESYNIEPMELKIRNKVGISINPDEINEKMTESIEALLNDEDSLREKINGIMDEYVFYPGRSGEAGGRYIIKMVNK